MRRISIAAAGLVFAACLPKFEELECYSPADCPLDQDGGSPDTGAEDADEVEDAEAGVDDGGSRDAADGGTLPGVWRRLAPATTPLEGVHVKLAYSPLARRLVLVPGCVEGQPAGCDDAWFWSAPPVTSPGDWSAAPAGFTTRRAPVLVEAATGELLLFGGLEPDGATSFADTWSFDGAAWSELSLAQDPAARFVAAAAYDPVRRLTVMFGGRTCPQGNPACRDLADTCFFEIDRWRCVELPGPEPRSVHAMAYDAARGRIVLFGGYGEEHGFFGDTWFFDGASWERADIPGPGLRAGPVMTYDGDRAAVVLFGGETDGPGLLDDTWELRDRRWFRVETSSTPPARRDQGLAWDAGSGRIIMFGGRGHRDTWEYLGN